MSIIVQKFGGSSVADADRLKKVARKVVATREAGHDVVVVVSAMGNTTDELLALSRQVNPQASRRELDMLLSVGERISMSLLSMAIHGLGFEAISLTGSQSGIITNNAHANARIIDVRPFRIQDELARGAIVIVAGYQGTSYKREITTLGRGGSDTTAITLAGALGAEVCEIYSDVDGIFTSDPRVVLDAQRLEQITSDEMLELARHGARVLNAEAVAYARRNKVALHARSAHHERSKGTVVRPDGWPQHALRETAVAPRGVASLASLLMLEGHVEDLSALLTALDEEAKNAAIVHLDVDAKGRTLALVDPTQLQAPENVAKSIAERLSMRATLDHANVTLVGAGIGESPEWVLKVSATWREAGVAPKRLWTRTDSISGLFTLETRENALRAAHHLVEAHDPLTGQHDL